MQWFTLFARIKISKNKGGDNNMETLYTVEQVAEKFEVHPETVRRLARDGTLTGKKIGNSWRFSDKDLEKFLSQSEVTNQ